MELYDGWSRAVDNSKDAIEAYLAAHLYPELPACASGEKQLGALTADSDSIRRVRDWATTWGPLNGTIPDGRIYEVQLTELDSPSHVTILKNTAYVFWNCTGEAPASFVPPAARNWDHIHELPDGLSCQALIEGGYSYEEAYVYWLGENDNGYMIDYEAGENVICQSTYPQAVVSAFWDDSSPVTADQFAIIESIDVDERTIVADYASILWGEEARQACEQDGHECEWLDVYIRNENPRLRTLTVAPDAVIAAWTWIGGNPYVCAIAMPWQMNEAGFDMAHTGSPACFYSLEDFRDLWNSDLVWLAGRDGVVTGIQTQYTP